MVFSDRWLAIWVQKTDEQVRIRRSHTPVRGRIWGTLYSHAKLPAGCSWPRAPACMWVEWQDLAYTDHSSTPTLPIDPIASPTLTLPMSHMAGANVDNLWQDPDVDDKMYAYVYVGGTFGFVFFMLGPALPCPALQLVRRVAGRAAQWRGS